MSRNIKPIKLEVGRVYNVGWHLEDMKLCVFIRTTASGYNFFDIENDKLFLKNHLYKSKYENHQDGDYFFINQNLFANKAKDDVTVRYCVPKKSKSQMSEITGDDAVDAMSYALMHLHSITKVQEDIMGYIVKSEYKDFVETILNQSTNTYYNSPEDFQIFKPTSWQVNRIKEAGTLDLWLESIERPDRIRIFIIQDKQTISVRIYKDKIYIGKNVFDAKKFIEDYDKMESAIRYGTIMPTKFTMNRGNIAISLANLKRIYSNYMLHYA